MWRAARSTLFVHLAPSLIVRPDTRSRCSQRKLNASYGSGSERSAAPPPGSSRFDARHPGGDLPVSERGRVELLVPHRDDGDPHEITPLKYRIRRDVDAGDRERPIEPDPPERAVRLLTQVAAGPLVQPDRERRSAVGPQAHERETTPDVPAEHG